MQSNYKKIAFEVGKFKADVLMYNEKQIVEVEVKTSFQDLKNELTKRKHKIYEKPTAGYSKILPNKFYFAFPEAMCENQKVIDFVEEHFPAYGILHICIKMHSYSGNPTSLCLNASLLLKLSPTVNAVTLAITYTLPLKKPAY